MFTKLFSNWQQKRLQARFKRKGFNLIETIPFETYEHILRSFINEGWEVDTYINDPSAIAALPVCKVRKGQSTLIFKWENSTLGSIMGLERILLGLTGKYNLPLKYASKKLEN